MHPTKAGRAGHQQQREHWQAQPQQQKGSRAKQTRSEIENQPPAWAEAAGGPNLGASWAPTTREVDCARTDSLASTSRAVPIVEQTEGANKPILSCAIEFHEQPDCKQSSEKQSARQIDHPRAPVEPTKVEANKARGRSCSDDDDERGNLEEPSRRQASNDDTRGQIGFEQRQRQVPSDFRDSRPDQPKGNVDLNTAPATGSSSSSSSRATGTAVVCGLVDGRSGSSTSSDQTAAGRRQTSSASDKPTGASDKLPVGCQKLPEPPARLFNQNSSSSSNNSALPSEQTTSQLERVLVGANQKQQQQQRIKVTLSEPKQEFEQGEEESRKLGKFYTQPTSPLDQRSLHQQQHQQVATEGPCSVSSFQVNFGQVRAPRRSTATLISGSSEPEVDSVEFYARDEENDDDDDDDDDDSQPQEKINRIWRDRGPPPPPPPALTQDTSRRVGAQAGAKDAGQRELELTRLERENQLRRIASQRRRAPAPASGKLSASTEATTNETTRRRSVKAAPRAGAASDEKEKRNFLLATATSRVGQQTPNKQQGDDLGTSQLHESQTTKIVIPQAYAERAAGQQQTSAPIKQVQTRAQPAVVSQDPSLPSKQLAIYINGKIRSNSIFCSRSVSSNSFTSILRSFQHHPSAVSSSSPSSNDQQQPASDLEKHQQQQGQLLVCKANNEPQAFLTGSHNKSQAAADANKEPSDGEDFHTEGQPANKSFVHCLVPRRSQRTQPHEIFGGGHQNQHSRENKRGFLAYCCDYILNSGSGASKSTGIYDTGKRQGSAQNTSEQASADQQPRTYKLNPSSMFLRKAMRYYRLWIYSANLTILLGAIIFLLSTLYVVSDHRFQLIVASSSWPPPPVRIATTSARIMGRQDSVYNSNKSRLDQISGDNLTQQISVTQVEADPSDLKQLEQSFTISLSEPTIILAYLMIVFQMGLLQALGCFGAIQMKERLIQAFWFLILALIVTDVLILVYWLQRYDSMLRSLRYEMTSRLERQYGHVDESELQEAIIQRGASLALRNSTDFNDFTRKNGERQQSEHAPGQGDQTGSHKARLQFDKIFTQIFDRIQSEFQCCGVGSSIDYKHTRWRESTVAQLREQYLKQEQNENEKQENQERVIFQLDKLLAQLPLVPASCCRPSKIDESRAHKQANVIQQQQQQQHLDDSQLPQRARVPAWSPSMVVDNFVAGHANTLGAGRELGPKTTSASQQQRRAEDETNDHEEKWEEPTLADVIDRRWSGSRSWRHSEPDSSSGQHEPDSAHDDESYSADHVESRSQTDGAADNKKTTRLWAKQMHYGRRGSTLSVADGSDDVQEANFLDLERPERVARHLQRRAVASKDKDENEDEDEDEDRRSTWNSYDKDEDEDEEQRPESASTRNELEDAQDNNNNESGRRRWRQYRAENDELSSSSSDLGESLLAMGLGGELNQLLPHISNSQQEEEKSDQWAIETKLDKRGRVLARLVELATARRQANNSSGGPDEPFKLPGGRNAHEAVELRNQINNELRLGLNRDQFQLIESYLTSDEIGQMTDEQLQHRKQQQQQRKTPMQADKIISRRSILSAASAEDQDKQQQQQEQSVADAEQRHAKQRERVKQLKRLQELVARGGGDQSAGPACSPRSHYDEERIYTRGCQAHIRAWIQSSANILFVMGFCVLTVLKFCSLILLRLEIREMIHKIKVLKGMATEYNALQDLEPYLPRPSICAQAAELTSTGVTSALGVSAGGSPTAQIGSQSANLSSSVNAIGQQQVGVSSESGGCPLVASCSSPTGAASGYMGVPRRIGGSFSEAVAAATAVAHQQKLAEQQQQAQLARHLRHCERASSLANCARAASTKTILGGRCSCAASLGHAKAGMLAAPHQAGLCPCGSSLSMSAHLSHSASQSQAATGGLSLRSDLFPPLGVAMPRRHTAVSVCPAAAAMATAAAHHLMMRRGTFALANPLTFTSTGQQQQQQGYQEQQSSQQPGTLKLTSGGCSSALLSAAVSTADMLQAKSLNYLNQHRHSAHALPPSHLIFSGYGGGREMNFLNPTNIQHQQQQARRSSNLSPREMAAANNKTNHQFNNTQHLEPRSGDDNNNQQQQQQPVFRRQASGGAKSDVNFSLETAASTAGGGQLGESRRSIH